MGLSEMLWIVSVMVPVLFVIAALFDRMNGWLAVIPGFMGGLSFLIVLVLASCAALLPSTFVARWRDAIFDHIADIDPQSIVLGDDRLEQHGAD